MAKAAKSTKDSSKEKAKSSKASKANKAAKAAKATTVKPAKSSKAAKSSKSVKKILKLTPVVRLAISNEDSSSNSQFGRGIANLCMGIRKLGSLNAAAKSMGMAYSKAWRIVKDTEEALGMQLLVRDGAHGSSLTDEGNLLLDAYLKIDKKMQESAHKEFQKFFKA